MLTGYCSSTVCCNNLIFGRIKQLIFKYLISNWLVIGLIKPCRRITGDLIKPTRPSKYMVYQSVTTVRMISRY